MSTNLKVTHDIPVRKGDIVIREDGNVYMLNWNVTSHANNQATQIVECNAQVEFTRYFDDKVDSRGFLMEPGGRKVVVPLIPISHQEYAGRPDYSVNTAQPGTTPDHLITVSVQWNSTTKNIELDDEFIIGDFTYHVNNISIAEGQIDKDYGVLTLNAKRVAGGEIK